MKKVFSIILALGLLYVCITWTFADGIDGPKTESVGCGTPASTTPSDWAKEDSETALKLGILEKDKDYYYGSFITREEFCEIVYSMIQLCEAFNSNTIDEKFNIVDTDSKAVHELTALGIISGKKDEKSDDKISITFAPDDLLTREEAATIIKRVLDKCDGIAYTEMFYKYDDESDIAQWAKNAVQALSNAGIMEGFGNSVFYPKSALSTEEAVVIAVRAYNYINPKTISDSLSFEDKINACMPSDKNYMFSPLSIKIALAMAANGADGETKKEILDALNIVNLEEYNSYAKNLIDLYSKTDKLQVNIANSVWLNESKSDGDFTSNYKSDIADFYEADVKKVNNNNAVKEINAWVNEKTNGKIQTIRSNSDFWVSIINAVYFKGFWQDDFSEYLTKDDSFYNADGSTAKIPFMNKTAWTLLCETDSAKIITLPYKNSFYIDKGNGNYEHESYNDIKANMHFILSDNDNIDIENLISNNNSENRYVKLSLPKFKFEYSVNLNDILKESGISKAFSEKEADFSKMFTGSNLWIDSVMHKTFISVDEKGTEAAAVTEVAMAGSSLPPEPIEIKFDKPFYFAIEINGEILFMGRYAFAE